MLLGIERTLVVLLRADASRTHVSVLCQMAETLDLIHHFSFSSLENESSHNENYGDDHENDRNDDTY